MTDAEIETKISYILDYLVIHLGYEGSVEVLKKLNAPDPKDRTAYFLGIIRKDKTLLPILERVLFGLEDIKQGCDSLQLKRFF